MGLIVVDYFNGVVSSRSAAAFDFGDDFLFLHPPVLKPNSDLSLREVGDGGDLSPLVLGDEFVAGVFLLQLLQLPLAIRDPFLPTPAEGAAVRRVLSYSI